MTGDDWQLMSFSARMAAASTLLILPPGVALAWLLARKNWRGKVVVETFVALPLVLPPVVTGLVLLKFFGRRGPVGHWLHDQLGLEIIFTWRAVVLALAVMSFPLLVRTLRAAIEEVNPSLEQMARTLGAGPWRVFFTITLPLAKRGLFAGTLLAFARALGEFGATIMVAGNIPGRTTTLAVSIYQSVELGEDSHALLLAGLSASLAFAALLAAGLLQGGKR
jgi:molybdate transport system permease protein